MHWLFELRELDNADNYSLNCIHTFLLLAMFNDTGIWIGKRKNFDGKKKDPGPFKSSSYHTG